MAAMWVHCDGEWGVAWLTTGPFALRDELGAVPVRRAPGDGAAGIEVDPAALVRGSRAPDGPWVLLAAPGSNARVNGAPIFGMRILADRDEVRLGRQQWYYTSERLVRPEAFAGREGTCCARCGGPIAKSSMAVRCRCNLWYHQNEDLGCWLYAERCCGCEAPATIDAGFAWTPEGL